MRKVLITGINGQDGTILSNILVKKKFVVIGITNKKLKKKINDVKLVSTYNLNINKIIKKFEEIKPDIIVHFGSKNPSYYNNFIKKDYNYNLKFTKAIIDYVAQKKIKFIFPSSSSIFKYSKKKLNESSKVECKNLYSKFRINSSKYLLKIKKKKKINATIVILFNHDSKYRNKKFLFPRLINSIKKKRYLFLKRLYKENISGDFSHAHDICNAIFLLIEKNKNPDKIILSSGKRTYINHIIETFMPKFKKELKKLNLSKKALIIGNNKKAVNLLNWKIKKNSLLAAKELFELKK